MNLFNTVKNKLRPTAWKSESHLNKKDSNSTKSPKSSNKNGESIFYTKPLSKSSDWTEVDLQVPQNDDPIHLPNPKLNLIFDNNKGTPTPPPRKQTKGTLKEKVNKIASKGLQAFHSDKNKVTPSEMPVEEPLMIKKKINYKCPICESDEKNHNRDHHHPNMKKTNKRLKNLSVISLPNYSDLKLSLAQEQDSSKPLTLSRLSLQNPNSKKLDSSQSIGKLDRYITRCRSFGSILPQQLKKLRTVQKNKPEDITSDDSFGPLEDWDVGLIEHYNPKEASLPRPKRTQKDILDGIEGLIVKNDDIENVRTPQRPVRRSESLVKKVNKAEVAKAPEDICLTPPPSPIRGETVDETKRESVSEHSSLMRILQEFSIKDKQEKANGKEMESNTSSLTPSLVEFERTLASGVVEEFLNAEKNHTRAVCSGT
ncbi:hypothetical protein ABEB36_001239 [Hypothenemus hampei]|uniref:Uncharacterized protein n=1 Tax=Hypothenemus hampei TaxID=57062 RepID=A0ABD1FDX7_HYPHA